MNNQYKPLPSPQPIGGVVNNPAPCGEDHINPPGTVTGAKNINPLGIPNSETFPPMSAPNSTKID